MDIFELKIKIIVIATIIFILILFSGASILILNVSDLFSDDDEENANVEISQNLQYRGGNFPIPVENFITVTAGFTYYDPWGTGNFTLHTGVDLVGSKDSSILSVDNGEVVISAYDFSGYGNYVKIKHISEDGSIFFTLYGHMKESPKVKKGDNVVKGQLIGIQGSTGNSTGDHVHFEIIKDGCHIDPVPFLFKSEA